jgi:pseudouridine-5'-phosphate glycosidase
LDTVSSVSLDFSYTKCLDAIKSVADAFKTSWWYIGADGVLQFHPKSTVSTLHKVQIGRNVDKITIEENGEKIVNKYMTKYGGGSVYTKSDATSITNNGLRELYEDNSTKLTNLATATIYGDNYVSDRKDAKRKITIEINALYDIESIEP